MTTTTPQPDTAGLAEAVYVAIYGAMSAAGVYKPGLLEPADALALFLAGDGFGRITSRQEWEASGIGWDWSHVRDSTPEGWARVAATAAGLGITW